MIPERFQISVVFSGLHLNNSRVSNSFEVLNVTVVPEILPNVRYCSASEVVNNTQITAFPFWYQSGQLVTLYSINSSTRTPSMSGASGGVCSGSTNALSASASFSTAAGVAVEFWRYNPLLTNAIPSKNFVLPSS